MVRFGKRDYDSRQGRFTAKDPLKFSRGDINLYTYVSNSPLNAIDPSGMCPDDCSQNQPLVPLDESDIDVEFKPGVIDLFSPEMASLLHDQIQSLNDAGLVPWVSDGYRTSAMQKNRRQTTQYTAATKTSYHQTGDAIDFSKGMNSRSNFTKISNAMDKVLRSGRLFKDPVHWDRNSYPNSDSRRTAADKLEQWYRKCILGR